AAERSLRSLRGAHARLGVPSASLRHVLRRLSPTGNDSMTLRRWRVAIVVAMKNPDKLRVARAAEDLAVLVYDYTAAFPREERYGLAAQLRKTAVSIGSNIFEGCGRLTERGRRASLRVPH